MRSSQGNESITVALIVAVIIGLAGGYFLIKMEGREAAAPVSASAPAAQDSASRQADEEVIELLRDKEVSDEFADLFEAACSLGTQREAGASMSRAEAKQLCGCIFPWVQEKIMNRELTRQDFDRMRADKRFPNREMQREFNKEVESCMKDGAA